MEKCTRSFRLPVSGSCTDLERLCLPLLPSSACKVGSGGLWGWIIGYPRMPGKGPRAILKTTQGSTSSPSPPVGAFLPAHFIGFFVSHHESSTCSLLKMWKKQRCENDGFLFFFFSLRALLSLVSSRLLLGLDHLGKMKEHWTRSQRAGFLFSLCCDQLLLFH